MQSLPHRIPQSANHRRALRGRVGTAIRDRAFAAAVVLAWLAGVCTLDSQAPENGNRPMINPAANRLPDANAQTAMREEQVKKANFEAANIDRKKQIADDSARLLKLATDLKAEVEKTSKDTLSLGVIRKAEEIEKLAHSVKDKMKLTMGSN